jgi:hypothetical protein
MGRAEAVVLGFDPRTHLSIERANGIRAAPAAPFELLVQAQEEYDKAITGQQSARETMDHIAAFRQEHLTEEGLIE